MQDFKTLLKSSAEAHGHLCPGQVVGVRMALLGCRLIGLDAPRSRDQIKKLIIYVEMDRCTADAVAHVTGVKLGRRSLKFKDYGIMAASFVNLATGEAYRVLSTEEARDLVPLYAPEIPDKVAQQLAAYERMPDNVLFRVQKIDIALKKNDLPGPTSQKTVCERCGQVIRDGRQVRDRGQSVCLPCTDRSYFSNPREVVWEGMSWAPAAQEEMPAMQAASDMFDAGNGRNQQAKPSSKQLT